jgi:hypothetical protein
MPDVPYTDELPLNSDPRWTPIDSPFEWLRARLGDGHLAARDLDEELAQDRIRYMIRSIDTGERKLGLAARWAGKLTLRYWDGTPGVSIYYRNTGDPGTRVTGWMFYLWRPDFEAIWPADPNFPMLPAPEVLVPWGSRFRRIRDEMLADSPPPPLPVPAPPKPVTGKEREAERKRRASELAKLLRNEPDLTKAEVRAKDGSNCFSRCKKAIPLLGFREFKTGLSRERTRRRKLKSQPK